MISFFGGSSEKGKALSECVCFEKEREDVGHNPILIHMIC
jgi:hypothetical protein